jgi:hypothetical protein
VLGGLLCLRKNVWGPVIGALGASIVDAYHQEEARKRTAASSAVPAPVEGFDAAGNPIFGRSGMPRSGNAEAGAYRAQVVTLSTPPPRSLMTRVVTSWPQAMLAVKSDEAEALVGEDRHLDGPNLDGQASGELHDVQGPLGVTEFEFIAMPYAIPRLRTRWPPEAGSLRGPAAPCGPRGWAGAARSRAPPQPSGSRCAAWAPPPRSTDARWPPRSTVIAVAGACRARRRRAGPAQDAEHVEEGDDRDLDGGAEQGGVSTTRTSTSRAPRPPRSPPRPSRWSG